MKEKRIDKKKFRIFWNQNIHKVITYLDVPNLNMLSSASCSLYHWVFPIIGCQIFSSLKKKNAGFQATLQSLDSILCTVDETPSAQAV